MKRYCSLTLCVLSLIAVLFAGCAKAGSKASDTLSVMVWDQNQVPGLSQIFDDFTAQSGIKVSVQVVKWDEYWTLLAAGAQGGSLPDVFWMHSNEAERYMSNNMLLDLTDRIAQSSLVSLSDFVEDISDLYSYNGRVYAVPKDVDTIALWYNKTLFDEAGVPYPTADWSWDDLYDAAKALTRSDGSVYGIAMANSNNQAGYYNIIYDNGGYVISDDKKRSGYDDPKTIEAMQYVEKLIREGLMPSQDLISETGEEVLFSSGTIAMLTAGSWFVPSFMKNDYVRANADVVELPKNAETGRRVSLYNGLGWVVSARSANAENAWKLVEYLGSQAAQEKQAKLGVTMSARKGTSDTWAQSSSDFNLIAYLNMTEDLVLRPHSKRTLSWENAANDWFKRAWSGEITMEAACLGAADAMNRILEEE